MQPSVSRKTPHPRLEHSPIPSWVRTYESSLQTCRRDGEPITRLLLDIQHDTETKSSYIHLQQRLENKQAVQELAQWRINFDPNSQKIQLHHIRVIRDGVAREYSDPENVRIIQREEDLESYILHGQVTLLVVLEDIRIGDVIDTCYTQINQPQILPNHFSNLQSPPDALRTGDYHLSVRFPKQTPMQWQSANPENAPKISEEASHILWEWEEQDIDPESAESNIPNWQLPENWIHLSDMQKWSEMAMAAHEAWPNVSDFQLPAALESMVDPNDQKKTAEALIRYVQDEFRYLSVKTNLGGQIPNSPHTVIERCYGDCKDLSSLLTHLLRSQSIKARPILVNSELGKSLPELLPCATLFNHVIVEYQIDGVPYWVDPTLSDQGGDATGRYVPPYYFGLPIQARPTNLVEQPSNRSVKDRYELQDTILLDTANNLSILRVTTTVTGKYADDFRLQLSQEGPEGFIKSSEERQVNRYQTECAVEPVKYMDNRALNEWRMVEVYKIDFYKSMSFDKQFLQLSLPRTILMAAITVPEEGERCAAFAIPDDLDVTHIIEVHSKANGRQRSQKKTFELPGIEASVEGLFKSGAWTKTIRLKTSTDHIPAEQVASFRNLLFDLWQHASWVITAPRGLVRLHRPADFGQLMPRKAASQKNSSPAAAPSKQVRRRSRSRTQRLASHPEEIKKREQGAATKKSHSDKRNGFLKWLIFRKK
ncbi:DUF3857 domain-containing transglutaminase family protein [Coraliomargarita algicola]|uniref:DUF3857 domain-containing transglutaminase family protein n=1 Tax=Coraliomargarita algicola TaxID=3092156 RepID=A0ABZ0RR80_9BACT|nr:DUF3857 domain-containing transglutaminase family protein [Coraliomargarita sp. J2-16]WPJ97992.1 DUF3857 domain-containing transglutaminase family protein [Coraliomargarita sp. J2-16]